MFMPRSESTARILAGFGATDEELTEYQVTATPLDPWQPDLPMVTVTGTRINWLLVAGIVGVVWFLLTHSSFDKKYAKRTNRRIRRRK